MDRIRKYTLGELAALLPFPDKDANKYTRGKLTIVAGSDRFPGACALAALASQRMGAGYTDVLCAPEAVPVVRVSAPSLTVRSWKELLSYAEKDPDERDAGAFGVTRARTGAVTGQVGLSILSDAVVDRPSVFAPSRDGHPTAYLVGPGFVPDAPESAALANAVLSEAQAPVLIDGGGLSALATPEARLTLRRRFIDGCPTVVTPHAGEAARLAAPLKLATDDPARLAWLISLAYGVVAMVKGPVTYVSDGDRVVRMADGTPALAKAGTGDVLAGMAAALLAQGLDPVDACVLASTLHARAARHAAKRLTEICVTAEDVVAFVPEAVRLLAKEA